MLMPMLWRNDATDNCVSPWDEMDRMFNDFWGNGLESTNGMRTDVKETDNAYTLEADLPGFNKEDIHIDLKDDTLTISATHNENKDEKDEDGKYIRRERSTSSYQRSFHVENLQPEDIDAQYRNGVLSVTLPKKQALPEQEETKRIEIKD